MRNDNSPWSNPKVVKQFRDHYDGNYRYGDIAAMLNHEFGLGLTRNACIGKARRLNLPSRECDIKARGGRKATGLPRKPRPQKQPKNGFQLFGFDGRGAGSRAQRLAKRKARATGLEPLLPFRDHAKDIPLDQRKTFLELENHHCRYPFNDVGDAEFFFCGAPEADFKDGIPYCPSHMDRTHDGIPKLKEWKPHSIRRGIVPVVSKIFGEHGLSEVAE